MHDKKEISVFSKETVHLLSIPRVIAKTSTLCTHCLIPGHTAEKCFQKAQGKPAATPADALSRQTMYCTLCKKKGSHKAADCFKRPGHTVLAAWAHQPRRPQHMNGLAWLLHLNTTLPILPALTPIFRCIWILLLQSQPQPTETSYLKRYTEFNVLSPLRI